MIILRYIGEWDTLIQEKAMLREGLEVLLYDLECRIWRVWVSCLGKLGPEFLTLLKRLKELQTFIFFKFPHLILYKWVFSEGFMLIISLFWMKTYSISSLKSEDPELYSRYHVQQE